jgi:hypothetical protein
MSVTPFVYPSQSLPVNFPQTVPNVIKKTTPGQGGESARLSAAVAPVSRFGQHPDRLSTIDFSLGRGDCEKSALLRRFDVVATATTRSLRRRAGLWRRRGCPRRDRTNSERLQSGGRCILNRFFGVGSSSDPAKRASSGEDWFSTVWLPITFETRSAAPRLRYAPLGMTSPKGIA